jgi:hypothetical protein
MLTNSSVSTSGGAITLGGGLDIATGYARGEATRDTVTEPTYTLYISGVNLQSGTTLSSVGGDITLRGQNSGGSQNAMSFGVMGGGTTLPATIDSGTGKIAITGKATGSGTTINAQAISSYGTGSMVLRSANTTAQAISLVGDASGVTGGSASLGVNFSGTIEATGTGGGIGITGTAGTATTDWATTLVGSILAKSGPITLIGDNNSAQLGINFGTATLGFKAGTNVTSSSSNIVLKADAIGFGTTALNTTGTVGIYSLDSSASFGTATTVPNTFTLSAGVTGLTIGKSTNTAEVTLGGSTSIAGPINVYAGTINVNANLNTTTGGSSGDILLKASGNIELAASKTITTNGGDVVLWSQQRRRCRHRLCVAARWLQHHHFWWAPVGGWRFRLHHLERFDGGQWLCRGGDHPDTCFMCML